MMDDSRVQGAEGLDQVDILPDVRNIRPYGDGVETRGYEPLDAVDVDGATAHDIAEADVLGFENGRQH